MNTIVSIIFIIAAATTAIVWVIRRGRRVTTPDYSSDVTPEGVQQMRDKAEPYLRNADLEEIGSRRFLTDDEVNMRSEDYERGFTVPPAMGAPGPLGHAKIIDKRIITGEDN